MVSCYILGGITFFGFLILAATGVWLASFSGPIPSGARQIIAHIWLVGLPLLGLLVVTSRD